MALLMRGKTDCAICGEVINEGDEAILFAHIIMDTKDPLFQLSDSACHSRCVASDSSGQKMLSAYEESLHNSGPGHRTCAVCGDQIADPDDYLLIGRLTGDTSSPLHKFNYTHLHKSHIADWDQAEEFVLVATAKIDAGLWGGQALQKLVDAVNL